VRTLPLRLSPIEGESLPGYVVRYAHTFGLPPGEVVRAFGLGDTMREAGRYGARLRAQQLERVSTATGIDCDHLQQWCWRASSAAPSRKPRSWRQARFRPKPVRTS